VVTWESFVGNRVLSKEVLEQHGKLLVRDTAFDLKCLPQMYVSWSFF
jgi:hypothetical protein